MFGPPLLALGGLMVAIGYCYPTEEDKFVSTGKSCTLKLFKVFNFVRIKNIKKELVEPPVRSRNSLMAGVVPTLQENVAGISAELRWL